MARPDDGEPSDPGGLRSGRLERTRSGGPWPVLTVGRVRRGLARPARRRATDRATTLAGRRACATRPVAAADRSPAVVDENTAARTDGERVRRPPDGVGAGRSGPRDVDGRVVLSSRDRTVEIDFIRSGLARDREPYTDTSGRVAFRAHVDVNDCPSMYVRKTKTNTPESCRNMSNVIAFCRNDKSFLDVGGMSCRRVRPVLNCFVQLDGASDLSL